MTVSDEKDSHEELNQFLRTTEVPDVTLAIETGVRGGSLSLFRKEFEIDFWIGQQSVSRAEDILDEIDKILRRNNVPKKRVQQIIISNGPGSFTGLRIGASIAKGLSKSLDCNMSIAPILPALATGIAGQCIGNVIAAVPFGSNQVCWQLFCQSNQDDLLRINFNELHNDINVCPKDEFYFIYQTSGVKGVIVHEDVYEYLVEKDAILEQRKVSENINIVNAGKNLAFYVGKAAVANNSLRRREQITNDFELIYAGIK